MFYIICGVLGTDWRDFKFRASTEFYMQQRTLLTGKVHHRQKHSRGRTLQTAKRVWTTARKGTVTLYRWDRIRTQKNVNYIYQLNSAQWMLKYCIKKNIFRYSKIIILSCQSLLLNGKQKHTRKGGDMGQHTTEQFVLKNIWNKTKKSLTCNIHLLQFTGNLTAEYHTHILWDFPSS